VLAERLTFGKAAEEFGLRKTAVFYAVKHTRKPLNGIKRKEVETVLAQELAVSEVIGNSLRTIFMKKTRERAQHLPSEMQLNEPRSDTKGCSKVGL
jgi:hypothetical protein